MKHAGIGGRHTTRAHGDAAAIALAVFLAGLSNRASAQRTFAHELERQRDEVTVHGSVADQRLLKAYLGWPTGRLSAVFDALEHGRPLSADDRDWLKKRLDEVTVSDESRVRISNLVTTLDHAKALSSADVDWLKSLLAPKALATTRSLMRPTDIDSHRTLGGGDAAHARLYLDDAPKPLFSTLALHRTAAPPDYYRTRVYYGTDRQRTSSADPYQTFGSARGGLSFGTCDVAIPRDHEPGVLETHPFWRFWSAHDDPNKEVTLLAVDAMTRDQLVRELRKSVAASQKKRALIFIHGYNVSFADAVRRTAQLAFDLSFDGAPIAYSWPSNARVVDYEGDAANADWTGPHLHDFLSLVASQSGAEEASLIVHSMGNRALAAALNDLARDPTVGAMTFREIVLAAPDIDRDTFKDQIAPAFAKTQARVTLYASNHDEALKASEALARYPRAGDSSGGILITPGIQSVDASSVSRSLLGHSYFADTTSVISDIHAVVLGHAEPAARAGLVPVPVSAADKYWRFTGLEHVPASASAPTIRP